MIPSAVGCNSLNSVGLRLGFTLIATTDGLLLANNDGDDEFRDGTLLPGCDELTVGLPLPMKMSSMMAKWSILMNRP